jgi:hypothetical protein
METAPLKSFATWARTALIREVTARIAAVLAPGSSERVEQARAVAALEKAVGAADGGHKGRAGVADKVAYTWFNRIIALRFMDTNGYTGIGVVSPQAGLEVGQPEMLAEAKRGVIDAEVVSQTTCTAVAGLLDGTRVSGDPQGEAYALLLADYCHHWNRTMPFMFEREGDFTELLIPANLLADDSVLNRSVNVLTEDVCRDVEVIGWLYQFYISERKDEVFAGFKENKKAGADEIPAATQLFTPHWIVRYLVENSLGRLWMLNRPSSGLVRQMDYYIAPVDKETGFLKISKPEELKVIDPACGSGHMLTYAFDLLYMIYEEEGYGPAEIPGLILANNLYGTEIDPRAGALAAFALTMKARAKQRTFFNKQVKPNVCVIEPISFSSDELNFLADRGGDPVQDGYFWNQFKDADTLGSLIQPDSDEVERLARLLETLDDGGDMLKADTIERARRVVLQAEVLGQRYAVVVANPPYMGTKSMDAILVDYAKSRYKNAKSDLFAMFIERCLGLAQDGSMVGMITMQSWMFGSSLGQLRSSMLEAAAIRGMAHLGPGAFDTISGEVVSTTAFALEKTHTPLACVGAFVDLTRSNSEAGKSAGLRSALCGRGQMSSVPMSSFSEIPGSPIAYWASAKALAAFRSYPPLNTRADLKAGISTGDNSTFQRQWFEVSWSRVSPVGAEDAIGTRRWTPCSSGGRFRRWYGNHEVLMDWEREGARIRSHAGSAVRNPSFMGRAGLTYSKIGGSRFAVRSIPSGFVFDDTGRMIFPHDSSESGTLSALLNSSTSQYFLDLMSPGLTFTSTEIGKVPLAPLPVERLAQLAERAIEIAKADWDSTELSWDFQYPPVAVDDAESGTRLVEAAEAYVSRSQLLVSELRSIEEEVNSRIAEAYGLEEVVESAVPDSTIALISNPAFVAGSGEGDPRQQMRADLVRNLVSYAVGCMFGRYSPDKPGLILADQGATLQDYLAKVPTPTFTPDADNVIPIVDGDWFEDDIVARFRQFLRIVFGDQHFEENLRFVTESLGVKNLRDYFVKSFYKDHVQRYKKRPIYWLFSSPTGLFDALIYMHRYTPSTVSTVLNEYLREFQAKLKASLEHAERSVNAKEADRLRKILLELDEYEHDVLYPLASQNIVIDLDDGVKANYPKFGEALKKIPGLEASE